MFKFLTASTILAVGLSLAGGALAAPAASEAPRQAVVKYSDLNLANAAGVEAMNHRIKLAAREVCGPEPDVREIGDSQAYRACVTHAQAQAVQPLAEAMASTRLEEVH